MYRHYDQLMIMFKFREQMNFYKGRFEEEFDLILRDGVHYDLDSSGTFTDSEKQAFYRGRLVR